MGVIATSGLAAAQGTGPYASGTQPYAPPPQQGYYGQAQPVSLHNGMTFEANLGFGWLHASNDTDSDTSDLSLAGLSLGFGGWVNEHLAITGRIAGVTYSKNGGHLTNAFVGPVAQYWVDDHFWLGGGIGLSVLRISNDQGDSDSTNGIGLDLRVGYTFNAGTENTFNVSFELNPGHYSENGASLNMTGIGFLVGYQHL